MSCRYQEENRFEYGKQIRLLTLENERIAVQIEPWDGGRVTRLFDKTKDHEHIWTNPRTRHLSRFYAANYDDLSNSGIEEAFPTVGTCRYEEAILPFFGEIWSVPWDYQVLIASEKEISLQLSCYCSIFPARITKTISMYADQPKMKVEYEIENVGAEEFSYVFGVHPSICLSPTTQIKMPEEEYQINYQFPIDLETIQTFSWPYFGRFDLSESGRPDDNRCISFLSSQVGSGIYTFSDVRSKSGLAIEFDHRFFRCLSIWLIYGGWRGHYCAMTEFFTSWPAALDEAKEAGLARKLQKQEVDRTSITYSIFSI
jgi:hypothetical protein